MKFFSIYTPFSSGVVTEEDVNVHEFECVGNAFVETKACKPVFRISFKRKKPSENLQTSRPSIKPRDAASDYRFNSVTEFVGKNKQGLIDLFTRELQMKRSTVINAPGDSDVDIVRTVIQASRLQTTTLIREDTDVLILLLFYAEESKYQ